VQAKDAHHSSHRNASERRWADAEDQMAVSFGWQAIRLRVSEEQEISGESNAATGQVRSARSGAGRRGPGERRAGRGAGGFAIQ